MGNQEAESDDVNLVFSPSLSDQRGVGGMMN